MIFCLVVAWAIVAWFLAFLRGTPGPRSQFIGVIALALFALMVAAVTVRALIEAGDGSVLRGHHIALNLAYVAGALGLVLGWATRRYEVVTILAAAMTFMPLTGDIVFAFGFFVTLPIMFIGGAATIWARTERWDRDEDERRTTGPRPTGEKSGTET